ncbi:MAG TPA: hypothetical protein VMU89_15420 [Thermomicrobiaceae bacterium]|nr:hypothetical protein [Thermomicrobiaceae bacterium]
MGLISDWINRLANAFTRQGDVRRAAILGIGFGLLLVVVVFLSCILLFTVMPSLR